MNKPIKNKIQILISCHKPSRALKTKYISPIQVGTVFSKNKMDNMFHDDEYDNISQKNKRYCELTGQYFAWKNIESEYYGFFHYRRYLSFADKKFFRMPFVDVKCKQLDEKAIKKFEWTDERLEELVSQYDVIVPQKSFCVNNYYHYKTANGHKIRDLDFCLNVIKNDYPEIYKSAKKYMHSGFAYFCNIFIMKKEIFNDYCEFLFDVLDKHEKEFDCKDYNTREYRVSGFLAERLCGIYLTYLKTKKNIKFKTLQRVKFNNTDI